MSGSAGLTGSWQLTAGKSAFIPNSSVSCVPKNAVGTRCPGSEFQQTPASPEFWSREDLFPSADRRNSFVKWLGATHLRQDLVHHKKSPMRRACIWERDPGRPSTPHAPVVPRCLLLLATGAADTAAGAAGRKRRSPARASIPEVPHPPSPRVRKSRLCPLFHTRCPIGVENTPLRDRICPRP